MKNKVAIITGATLGMGLAIAHKLASQRCSLVLLARNKKELIDTTKLIRQKYKVHVEWYACDVTKKEEIQKTEEKIKEDFKVVDILVNSAGGSHITDPKDIFDEAFDQDIALNLRGTHLCCKLFSELIKDGGAIVNISSLSGQAIFYPAYRKSIKFGYAAAKAGVIQLTRAYAVGLADRKIRVNAVAPGLIYPTGMTETLDKEKQDFVASGTPLQRLGTPEDIANAVYFLVSDLSSFITGHTLNVNGGRWMD